MDLTLHLGIRPTDSFCQEFERMLGPFPAELSGSADATAIPHDRVLGWGRLLRAAFGSAWERCEEHLIRQADGHSPVVTLVHHASSPSGHPWEALPRGADGPPLTLAGEHPVALSHRTPFAPTRTVGPAGPVRRVLFAWSEPRAPTCPDLYLPALRAGLGPGVELVELRDATLEDVRRALVEAQQRGEPFDTLHLLVHGITDRPRVAPPAEPEARAGGGRDPGRVHAADAVTQVGVELPPAPCWMGWDVPTADVVDALAPFAPTLLRVVLAACTQGDAPPGQDREPARGYSSLARELHNAGIRTVVACRWELTLRAACVLAEVWHQSLPTARHPACALAEVRKALAQRDGLSALGLQVYHHTDQPESPRRITDVRSHMPAVSAAGIVGRRGEQQLLDDALQDEQVRVLVLYGLGGVGKTTLVTRWLETLEGRAQRPATLLAWSTCAKTHEETSADRLLDMLMSRLLGAVPASADPIYKMEQICAALTAQDHVLVIDGIEALLDRSGRFTSPSLGMFLRRLSDPQRTRGLVVLTARERIADLHSQLRVRQQDLGGLDNEAGAELLRLRGVRARKRERRRAAETWHGHPLALELIAAESVSRSAGRQLPRWELKSGGVQARIGELLQSYLDSLSATPATVQLLSLLSLFWTPQRLDHLMLLARRGDPGVWDRPGDVSPGRWETFAQAVGVVETIDGLTDALVGLEEPDWRETLGSLAERHMVGLRETSGRALLVELHPVLREALSRRLEATAPQAGKEVHRRAYCFLAAVAEPYPGDRAQLALLLDAIVHGVRAGLAREALDALSPRINHHKKPTDVVYFANRKLGAHADLLAAEQVCFEHPFEKFVPGLTPHQEADLLFWTGYALCAVGRVPEGIDNLGRSAARFERLGEGGKAAEVLGEQAERLLLCCEFDKAREAAERSVELAQRAWAHQPHIKAALRAPTLVGAVKYCQDRLEEARTDYESAERLLARVQGIDLTAGQPAPTLPSMEGYRVNELLLARREFDRVIQRCGTPDVEESKLARALRLLALGRAYRGKGDLDTALYHLESALVHFEQACQDPYLPLGLIALAGALRERGAAVDHQQAEEHLRRAQHLASLCEIPLRIADVEIAIASLAVARLAQGAVPREDAVRAWHAARERVYTPGQEYLRRGPRIRSLGVKLGFPRVIVVHGFGSDPQRPKAQAALRAATRAGLDSVCWDHNQPLFRTLTVSRVVQQLLERVAAAPGPVVLVGSSMGGFACMLAAAQLARERPAGRLKGLFLVAPAIRFPELIGTLPAETLQRWRTDGELVHPLAGGTARGPLAVGFLDDALAHPPVPDLPDTPELPIRILHGLLDTVTPFCNSTAYRRGRAHTELKDLPCGHELEGHIDHIEEELLAFLTKLCV